MTDDRGNMSFSDPQLEFFNFDALSDDEVQRIKNLLKQPCAAVELPDISICSIYKDQVNGLQTEYKNVPLAISMDYGQVATTYTSMSQPHIYSVASTINGPTYTIGYTVHGTNLYVPSTTPRKEYIIPKMMNGMEGIENGGGGNMDDPNGVQGMTVVSSSLYPGPPWTNVYPCPTFFPPMPTFFTPIAPVHAANIRAATSTVNMCGENGIPTTVASHLPPAAATYVAVAPVAIQSPIVAEASVLQQSSMPLENTSSLGDQDGITFTAASDFYEKTPEPLEPTVVEQIGFENEENVLKSETIATQSHVECEIVKQNEIQAPVEMTDVSTTTTIAKDSVVTNNAVASSKTWASLFKGNPGTTRNARSSQPSPANQQLAVQVYVPATLSTESTTEKAASPVANEKENVSLNKPKKADVYNTNNLQSNDYSHTNGLNRSPDSSDRNLGEWLLNMKVDQRPVNFLPRGLFNKGNWCYINATLQALLACPPFCNFLFNLPNVAGLHNGKSNTPVTDCMVEFVHEFSPLNYAGGVTTVSRKKDDQLSVAIGHPFEPTYIYNVMAKVKSDAFEGRQEDAEEFLSCLLNRMHDEMLAALSCVENNDNESNGKVVELNEEDEESWKVIEKGNKSSITRSATFSSSPVSDIFCGRIRSALHSVSTSSATLQPFFSLQLDIQSENVRSVKDALLGLVTKENLQGYHCSKTKLEVAASRQITLEELPPILILHLKRFVYDKEGGCQKLSKKLDFKIDLEFGKELLSNTAKSKLGGNKQKLYKLIAVVYHCGREAVKGHYVADVYHHGSSVWLRTDDTRLALLQESEVMNHPTNLVPYMLFYRRLDETLSNLAGSVK